MSSNGTSLTLWNFVILRRLIFKNLIRLIFVNISRTNTWFGVVNWEVVLWLIIWNVVWFILLHSHFIRNRILVVCCNWSPPIIYKYFFVCWSIIRLLLKWANLICYATSLNFQFQSNICRLVLAMNWINIKLIIELTIDSLMKLFVISSSINSPWCNSLLLSDGKRTVCCCLLKNTKRLVMLDLLILLIR